ncbi:unnamed protein product [Colletotrichum noveboracense]|uniref:Uncharacterized protein n=1 Tax=Colletotrichum noveboracense TaxID=2664923 RepID=A0A9W4RMH8_9PEZI|nr:unnamed protein product [Colletotrichum noveboracense]
MFSKEIRAAAIEAIKAANQRRREDMVAKVGRQLYALSAAQNKAKLNSPVASSNPVHGGEQDANYDASANSKKEKKKGKETVTSPSSTDQQTTDDASVTGELLDPETDKRRNVAIRSSSSPSAGPLSGSSSSHSSGSSSDPSSGPSSGPSSVSSPVTSPVSSPVSSPNPSTVPLADPDQPLATVRKGLHRAMLNGLLHKRRECEQQRAAQIKANEAQSRGLAHLGHPNPSASRNA